MAKDDWRAWEIHPIAHLMPTMTDEEFRGLVEDIRQNGQRDPIERYEGKILDGRHRFAACVELDRRPDYINLPPSIDPVAYVISKNVHRRHLSTSQRAMLAVKTAMALKVSAKRAKGKQIDWARDLGLELEPQVVTGEEVREQILGAKLHPVSMTKSEEANLAKAADVSPRAIRQAQAVANRGIPDLTKAVESREIKLGRAEAIAALPEGKQAEALEQAIAQTGTRKPMTTPEEKEAAYEAAVAALLAALMPYERECERQLSRKPRTGTTYMTLHETTASQSSPCQTFGVFDGQPYRVSPQPLQG